MNTIVADVGFAFASYLTFCKPFEKCITKRILLVIAQQSFPCELPLLSFWVTCFAKSVYDKYILRMN